MQTLFSVSLLLHIIGLTAMAGATLADTVIYKRFWEAYLVDAEKGLAIRKAVRALPILMGVGTSLLILSGVGMMAATKGVFGEQLWFRIKIALVLLIILNGVTIGRTVGIKISLALANGHSKTAELLQLQRRMRLFHIAQLSTFFIIFLLSAFKFN